MTFLEKSAQRITLLLLISSFTNCQMGKLSLKLNAEKVENQCIRLNPFRT
jgi:hypothetical protein